MLPTAPSDTTPLKSITTTLESQQWRPVRKGPGEKIGVALVGLGKYSAEQLAPGLARTQYCRLAGIVTGDRAKAVQWQAQYHLPERNVYCYETFDDIATNPEIDVVYIVTPNSSHADLTLRAAAAHKHVWCEKPMAMTVAQAYAMIEACQRHQVALSIGYRLHHEPNNLLIRDFAQRQPYGPVRHVSVATGHDYFRGMTRAQRPWRLFAKHGGGAMLDMGIYSLNAARYAVAAEPIAVSARVWTDRPQLFDEVDEHVQFTLEFPGGVTADCATSFGQEMNQLQVECANGNYTFAPYQPYEGIRGWASDGQQFALPIGHAQALQMDHDAQALFTGSPLRVPGIEGLRDLVIIEAIFQSVRRSGMRIRLDPTTPLLKATGI